MLQITIPARELYDEAKEEFVTTAACTLRLEHSLLSISKWESKWHKPFMTKEEKTFEETIDYIRCMTLTQNVPSEVYFWLTDDNIREINEYIEDPMTATTFVEDPMSRGKMNGETITSELIYYWMTALQIPSDYDKWHLNRLLTLIKVCNIKNQPPKKMGKKALMSRNAQLNAARRQQLNTKG